MKTSVTYEPNKAALDQEARAARRKRMLAELSNTRTIMFVAVAFLIHAVIAVATSTSTISRWMGHDAASSEQASQSTPAAPSSSPDSSAAARSDSSSGATGDSKTTPSAGPNSGASNPSAGSTAAPGLSDDDKKMAELKNNPEVKRVTDSAKPGDLPKTPQHNSFDIDENPK